MAAVPSDILRIPRGYRSSEAASFVAQLDELTARLRADLKGVTTRELEWQPAPGINTIGMLLAHIAIVEVWWIDNGLRGVPAPEVDFVGRIGIGMDGDGIPLPPRGGHPATLKGMTLSDYDRMLRTARAHVRRVARTLSTADLERRRRRLRRDGKTHAYNARWVLYHLVEHLAGHYGQILVLRHAWRDRRKFR
jgi:uncharacterized damage-inducible protein DinB